MNYALDSLLPFAVATGPGMPQIIATWSVPIVLVVLYLLLRTDSKTHVTQLREGLDQIAASQRLLADHMSKLQDNLEQLRTTSKANTSSLVEAVHELKFLASSPKENASMPNHAASISAQGAAPPANAAGSSRISEAQSLLAQPDLNYPAQLHQVVALLEAELDGPHAAQALVDLTEAYFWLGELAASKEDKEKYHGEGVSLGKRAVISADSAAAHLWHAANMGAHGQARGIMSSLFYLGDIEKHGTKAMALDKQFFHGAPLRLMGRFYHQCPGFPIGKGDTNKAIKLLEEVEARSPEFLMNGYYLADAYLSKRKKAEARKVLERVLAVEEYALMPNYMKSIQDDARKLLAKC